MTPGPSGLPLGRRVLVSILAVTALAVILFALPLGVAVQRLYRTEAVTALQRDAARAAAVVPDTIPGGPVSLPRQSPSQPVIGVYDTAGPPRAGPGPAPSALPPARPSPPGPGAAGGRRPGRLPPRPPPPNTVAAVP